MLAPSRTISFTADRCKLVEKTPHETWTRDWLIFVILSDKEASVAFFTEGVPEIGVGVQNRVMWEGLQNKKVT